MNFKYDPRRDRYIDSTGRHISPKAIKQLINRNIKRTQKQLKELTRQLYANQINLSDWQKQTMELIKILHIQNLIIGRGGKERTYAIHYLTIARILKKEYGYLRKFASDIQLLQVSENRAIARIVQYANKSRVSYWQGKDPRTEMRRVLGITDYHCSDCLFYAQAGWQLIGRLPLPTVDCKCGSNCLCEVEYR